jgi:hypothetical protein
VDKSVDVAGKEASKARRGALRDGLAMFWSRKKIHLIQVLENIGKPTFTQLTNTLHVA